MLFMNTPHGNSLQVGDFQFSVSLSWYFVTGGQSCLLAVSGAPLGTA